MLGCSAKLEMRLVKNENAVLSGKALRLSGMTKCSQRYCLIDAPWLGGGCAACCGLLIPYVVAGEAT